MTKPTKTKKEKPFYFGGQAVIEGVMMRGKTMYSIAVRDKDGVIQTVEREVGKKTKRLFFLKWPIIRGVVAFVSSLVLGMKVLFDSAEMSGLDDLEEDEPSKFDKFLEKKFGDKLFGVLMGISVVIALAISVLMFAMLPVFVSGYVMQLIGDKPWARSIIEGILRIIIFLIYITIVSKTKDIKRVFAYHGAEHKTINCYESKEELTVENVRKHSRMHKRCGTSFLLIVMLVSIIVFCFVFTDVYWLRVALKILFLPAISGISYEIIKWAGRSENIIVKIVSFPGICLQKLTTNEPDDEMIEVAVTALKKVIEVEVK